MEVKQALKGQYKAGLAMLREAILKCPEDLWIAGSHPRSTWRIVYHAIFYTHLYIQVNEAAFTPWPKHRDSVRILWGDGEVMPPAEPPYTRDEMVEYLDMVNERVDEWMDVLDLASPDPGFDWYHIPKLDHQILTIRHLQGHVGQLSELLMARGIDIDWISKR